MNYTKFSIKAIACIAAIAFSLSAMAKDIQTAVFTLSPKLECSSCEKRVKEELRFAKGIKDIIVDIPENTVTLKYDADKTDPQRLADAFRKIDYTATPLPPDPSSPLPADE